MATAFRSTCWATTKRRLITGVARAASGHRRYSEADAGWIEVLRCLRLTGMSIQQMKHFAKLGQQGQQTEPERYRMLLAHRQLVLTQIAELHDALAVLDRKTASYLRITDVDDFRFRSPDWLNFFEQRRPVDFYIRRLDAIRDILTGNGRTLAQCWLLARSPNLIPIPGARTVEQARDNAQALRHRPLTSDEVDEIRELVTLAATR